MSVRLAIIGECMLELRKSSAEVNISSNSQSMEMGYGGDTLNTAIYLSRAGVEVSYVSALGDDPTSDWLIGQWQAEGIDCRHVKLMANSVPGMYMIDVDADGERSFFYWRKNSPASQLFDDESQANKLFKDLKAYSHLYLSGISLAILPPSSRDRLLTFIEKYHQDGGIVIFDGNYRPNLWKNPSEAQETYRRVYAVTTIALPTLEDEEALFGYEDATEVIDAIAAYGVPEIIVKMGSEGCLTVSEAVREFVASIPTTPVDTTAAGDSFNAGYLSARLSGDNIVESCRKGHGLASQVIQHHGAIIPKS